MSKDEKKPRKKRPSPGRPGNLKPRNPFAGRPQSGAGFHSDAKYGKQDRRREKNQIDEESGEDADEEGEGAPR